MKFAVVDQELAAVDRKLVAVDQELVAVNQNLMAVDQELVAINQKLAAFNQKLDQLHTRQVVTTGILASSAIAIMNGLDGDKSGMRSFVQELETLVKCSDGGEDCKDGGGGKD